MASDASRALRLERGQAALAVALLALAMLAGLGVVARWGQASLESSRAQAAADAAALATLAAVDLQAAGDGVPPDSAAAAQAAALTGGALIAFESWVSDDVVHAEVIVQLGGQRAAAAAQLRVAVDGSRTEGPAAESYTAKRGRSDIGWGSAVAGSERADSHR